MLIGNIKHDAAIAKIKLSCVSFAPHSRIFLVGGSSISEIEQCLKNSTDPRKCRCHGKVFRSLTSHPKLVYSMKTCSWPLCVLWYSCFIPRLNFLVSSSSDPSPGIFFICKQAGRSKDPWCENWISQLLARCLDPQMKIQNCFPKAQLQYCH